MANFLKLFYFKTFILNRKSVIRLRIVLNAAIFLSIFAVSASAITIFFEKKIDKIEDQVAFDQLMAQTNEVSLTMITYSIMTSQNVFESFKKNYLVNQYYYWTKANISTERQLYFLNFMELHPYVERDYEMINVVINILKLLEINPKKIKKYEVIKRKTEYENIVNEMNNDIETMTTKDGIFDPQVIQDKEEYFKKYRVYLNLLLTIHSDITIFLVDAYDVIKKLEKRKKEKIIYMTKEISNLSDISATVIFFAFIIQLIIFLVIQYLEITAAKRNEDDEKG